MDIEGVAESQFHRSPQLEQHCHQHHHHHHPHTHVDKKQARENALHLLGAHESTIKASHASTIVNLRAIETSASKSSHRHHKCNALFLSECVGLMLYLGLLGMMLVDICYDAGNRDNLNDITPTAVLVYTTCLVFYNFVWSLVFFCQIAYSTSYVKSSHPRHFLASHAHLRTFATFSIAIFLMSLRLYIKDGDLHVHNQFSHRYSLRCQLVEHFHPDYCPYPTTTAYWMGIQLMTIGFMYFEVKLFHDAYAHHQFSSIRRLIPDETATIV